MLLRDFSLKSFQASPPRVNRRYDFVEEKGHLFRTYAAQSAKGVSLGDSIFSDSGLNGGSSCFLHFSRARPVYRVTPTFQFQAGGAPCGAQWKRFQFLAHASFPSRFVKGRLRLLGITSILVAAAGACYAVSPPRLYRRLLSVAPATISEQNGDTGSSVSHFPERAAR